MIKTIKAIKTNDTHIKYWPVESIVASIHEISLISST